MLEILAIFIVAPALASVARGRGGRPWVWGVAAVAGYILASVLAQVLLGGVPFAGWAGVGLVALYVRLFVGRGMPQPQSMWICKNCSYTNGRHAIICEACKAAYSR